ncbi:MAG: DM13 domain-containing protein [Rhodoglobus sp.]|nr:DM13 domain-containing protein [Rhodoglobus sp.]
MTKRRWIIAFVVAGLAAAAVVLALTKPWLLLYDVTVNETLPAAAPVESTDPSSSATPVGPVELASGTFISHAHETTGTVRIVQNPDGTRVLAIENLSTTNGPDVRVWLSAADSLEGSAGISAAGGAEFLELGLIKGNVGNQVYEIPADADLSLYRSVDLWCLQFGVSFGGAQLN